MTQFHIHDLSIEITGKNWGTEYDAEEAEQLLARALIQIGNPEFDRLSADKMALDAFIAAQILEIKNELNIDADNATLTLKKATTDD